MAPFIGNHSNKGFQNFFINEDSRKFNFSRFPFGMEDTQGFHNSIITPIKVETE